MLKIKILYAKTCWVQLFFSYVIKNHVDDQVYHTKSCIDSTQVNAMNEHVPCYPPVDFIISYPFLLLTIPDNDSPDK